MIHRLINKLGKYLLKYGRFLWLIDRLIPARLAAKLIGIGGLDYTKIGASRDEIITQYAEAANRLTKTVSFDINDNTRNSVKDLLVDITALGGNDHHTGVQRVSRSLLQTLPGVLPQDYQLICVYRFEGTYHYADLSGRIVNTKKGDIFLGLDLDLGIDKRSLDWLKLQTSHELKIYFVIYDILPLLRPDWFPAYNHYIFKAWFKNIVSVSNGLICISNAVADEVNHWIEKHPVGYNEKFKVTYFHLGADIESSLPTSGITNTEEKMISSIITNNNITFLMVGTLEPRKGYSQALGAFEILWAKNYDINLIIVGKEGWSVSKLTHRIRKHPEYNKRLFWFEKASDELLIKLYHATSVFLMASEGEGFGLPIIEAARQGLPVIVRDIPVFNEVSGNNVYYFKGTRAIDLSDCIEGWLTLYSQNKHPISSSLKWLTWKESTLQLLSVIFDNT
jgi:glycosyltransferase involved in cell wall biosynthesis